MVPRPLPLLAREMVNAEWNSLLLSMDYWDDLVQRQELPVHIRALVRDARDFTHRYLRFFDAVPSRQLQQDSTDEWTVLHQARGLLLTEWDTIRLALEQRTNDHYIPTLVVLDQLATESLRALFPAQAEKAVTYLHKTYDITRFAFSQVPIIGAPFSALHLPESWLSIPHEAGHYIFWNGTATMGEFASFYAALEEAVINALSETLGKRTGTGHFRRTGEIYRTWFVWLNEIFADIYGTLVAGPAIGWSMQRLLRSRLNRRDLFHIHDDPDHPDPYIRPFIHSITLRRMAELTEAGEFAEQLRAAADELDASWRESWPEGDPAVDLSTPDNWGSMDELLREDMPAVIGALMEVRLGNLDCTLAECFRQNRFYTHEDHRRIMEAADLLIKQVPAPDVASKLQVSAIAQLAIVHGADPAFVRHSFGFETQAQPPASDPDRSQPFDVFVRNVTGQKGKPGQQRAWRRVLKATASEVAYNNWHHHTHQH